MDEGTIRTALDILRDANLIRWATDGSMRIVAKLLPVTDVQAALFLKKTEIPVTNDTESNAPGQLEFTHPDYETAYRRCIDGGIPHALALEIVGLTKGLFIDEFLTLDARTVTEHLRNCRTGRYATKDGEVPHHGWLLLHKLKQIHRTRRLPATRSVSLKTIEDIEREESPQAKAEARRLEQEVAANPLHPSRSALFEDRDVVARVQMDHQQAYSWLKLVHVQITRHLESSISDYQEVVRLSGNLYQDVMARALDRVNSYYLKEPRATKEEFESAVNAALQGQGVPPIVFPKPSQSTM